MERRNSKMIQRFLPEETGLRAHVLRVAALAARAGQTRGFSQEECDALEHAALLHHFPFEQTEEASAARLAADLGIQSLAAELPPERPARIARLFRGIERLQTLNTREERFLFEAAALLEGANLFDEQIENLPYESAGAAESIQDLMATGMVCQGFRSALESFRVGSHRQIMEIVKRMPVFPKAAMDALRMARDPKAGAREIEKAISQDPVLAGEVIHLANSGLFGTWQPVNSLGMALARVGTIAAGKLIAAAAIRRCFVSASLHSLWSHSFESGENAARMAGETTGIDAGEAYLGGLVHDVGRLTFELSPWASDLRRWQEAGFPVTYAEFLVSGTDHGTLGAEILRAWRFPDAIIEAVKFHHRPELSSSRLAALLYAVEDLDEALPSCARDHLVAKKLEFSATPMIEVAG